MILRFLFFLLVIYLLYRFVFDFVLPIYRTTKQVKQGLRDMHDRMQGQQRQQPEKKFDPVKHEDKPGEYIDFEEVKD